MTGLKSLIIFYQQDLLALRQKEVLFCCIFAIVFSNPYVPLKQIKNHPPVCGNRDSESNLLWVLTNWGQGGLVREREAKGGNCAQSKPKTAHRMQQ